MARWYIIHAYSGFENKVRDQILSEAERKGLSGLVESVEVPTEQVTEVRRGKKVKAERKFFPGYVLAKLNMNDDVYHLVKNTPKVTGFLGANNKPQPITEAEAARILNTKEELAAAAEEARGCRLRNRRSGEGDERPVRQLQRRGRGTGFRQEPRQGLGRATPVESSEIMAARA
jgi:transcription antitermination factor NusG